MYFQLLVVLWLIVACGIPLSYTRLVRDSRHQTAMLAELSRIGDLLERFEHERWSNGQWIYDSPERRMS